MKTAARPSLSLSALALACSLVTGGCVAAKSADRVAQLQLDAISRLAENYAQDLAAMRSLAGALLAVQIETRRAALEEAILTRYVAASGDADLSALDAALSAPATDTPADPLVAQVRTGAMTLQEAKDWLEDFALAWRMNSGVDVRAGLVAQLQPMQTLAGARRELLDSLDAHAKNIASVFTDAVASSQALAQARALGREFVEPTQGAFARLWRDRVLASVRDPQRRAFLQTLLTDFAPNLLPQTGSSTEIAR